MRKFIIPLLVFFFTGCQGLLQVKPEMEVSGYPTETINAEGGIYKFTIKATHGWTATVSDSWIELNCTCGEAGTTELVLQVFGNDYHEERTSEIQFFCEDLNKTISIRQMQDNYIELTTDNATFDASGGELVINAMANIDYEIIIEDGDKDWIIPQTTRSLNSKSHRFLVSENTTTSDRKGEIHLTGAKQERTFTVSQSAFVPWIHIERTEYYFGKEGGLFNIEIESNCDVEIASLPDWIRSDSNNSKDTYSFSVETNEGFNARKGIISFTNKTYGVCVEVYVEQGCSSPFISVTPSKLDIPATVYSFDVSVESNVDIQISINQDWIRLTDQRDNVYSFTARENNTTENKRSATITFFNDGFNLIDKLHVYQENIKQFTPSQEVYTTDYLSKKMTISYYSSSSFNISTNVEWIDINESIYSGNHTINLYVQENNGKTSREAIIEVYDAEHRFQFSVIQNGKTSNGGDIDDMEHIEW